MELNIKSFSNNTLLEPGEIIVEELYTAKEKMDFHKANQEIKAMQSTPERYFAHPSMAKFKYQDDIILNSKNVFDIVYNTGQFLFKKINDKYTINDFCKDNLYSEDRNYFEDIFSKWIMEYGFPYQADDKDSMDFDTFIWDCLRLYVLFSIHKLMKDYKISTQEDPYFQLPNIINELNRFINLFKELWFPYGDIYRLLILEEKKKYSGDRGFRTYISDTSLQLNKMTDNEEYLGYIKVGMVRYIDILINSDRSKDFIFKKQSVLYFRKSNKQRKYYYAASLMGIAYNKLLENLISDSYDYEVKECKNPECDNYFNAYGNNQFCSEKCAKAVEKMNKRKYDKKHDRAKQQKLRRKYNKMLDELISLKEQYNFPKGIDDKIKHFIEKRKKNGISFHDEGIEKLYIEVKNYLKNKYNTLID